MEQYSGNIVSNHIRRWWDHIVEQFTVTNLKHNEAQCARAESTNKGVKLNHQTRELISARNTQHKYNDKDLRHLQRMYLWWSLCTLYLHACQVRVTAGDSGLCCCVMYFEC